MPRGACQDCGTTTSVGATSTPTHAPGLAFEIREAIEAHCIDAEAATEAVLALLATPAGAAATLAHLRDIGRTGVAYSNPEGGPATTPVH